MNKDKHVLPDDRDTFADRVRREARKSRRRSYRKTIYGPDNEVLSRVNVEIGREITPDHYK
ncbi:MAG: hypothetical protein N2484_05590 [Clostridia bacterium]|nr:hypothetical protein [Clostridia bacterium]